MNKDGKQQPNGHPLPFGLRSLAERLTVRAKHKGRRPIRSPTQQGTKQGARRMNGYSAAAQVTPSNSMLSKDDGDHWMHKLEAGALNDDDVEFFAFASPDEIPWLHEAIRFPNGEEDGEGQRQQREVDSPGSDDGPPRRCSRSLVRLLGMVQDQLDVEFYTSSSATNSDRQLQDRTPVVVSPIPSSTPWFREASGRLHQEDRSSTAADLAPADRRGTPRRPSKRTRFDRGGLEGDHDHDGMPTGEDERDDAMMMAVGEERSDSTVAKDFQPPEVVAKLYYDHYQNLSCHRQDKLRLNDVVEMVGILELHDDPHHHEQQTESPGDGNHLDLFPQWSLENPASAECDWVAPSSVPRLHVLWYQPRDLDQLAASGASVTAAAASSTLTATDVTPSPSCGAVLSRALSVSETCGQAVWMMLLSMAERKAVVTDESRGAVHWTPVQTPHGTTLGCASLNLVLPSAAACAMLQARLEQTLAQAVPQMTVLTLDPRSVAGLMPAKKLGRMDPTSLQLPKGSLLVINASAAAGLNPSQSSPAWQCLQELASQHKLMYNFEGIPIAFEADVRILVLSTPTSQHSLPCALQCRSDDIVEGGSPVSLDELVALRCALALARSAGAGSQSFRSGEYGGSRRPLSTCPTNIGFAPDVLERAQTDFLQRRQQARSSRGPLANETDFHRWLTLTRLQARGRAASMAEIGDWEQALSLDDAMRASFQL